MIKGKKSIDYGYTLLWILGLVVVVLVIIIFLPKIKSLIKDGLTLTDSDTSKQKSETPLTKDMIKLLDVSLNNAIVSELK